VYNIINHHSTLSLSLPTVLLTPLLPNICDIGLIFQAKSCISLLYKCDKIIVFCVLSWAGQSGVWFLIGLNDIPCCTITRLTWGPTQSPSQWVMGTPLPGLNQVGCEADHLNVVLRLTVHGTVASFTPPVSLHGMYWEQVYLFRLLYAYSFEQQVGCRQSWPWLPCI
jgi:hypothetical protein